GLTSAASGLQLELAIAPGGVTAKTQPHERLQSGSRSIETSGHVIKNCLQPPRQFVELYFYGSSARVSFTESSNRVPQKPSSFHLRAQRNAFCRRDVSNELFASFHVLPQGSN